VVTLWRRKPDPLAYLTEGRDRAFTDLPRPDPDRAWSPLSADGIVCIVAAACMADGSSFEASWQAAAEVLEEHQHDAVRISGTAAIMREAEDE
jgi:hypothetical protein